MPSHPLELMEVNGSDVVDKHDVIHEAKGPIRFQFPKDVDNDEPPNALSKVFLAIVIKQKDTLDIFVDRWF